MTAVLVSREHRFLFIHVQKTGGSAVSRALSDAMPDLEPVPGSKHLRLAPALEQMPELADFFILGFVRNPWERFHSWHSMIMRRSEGARDGSYDADRFAGNAFWRRVAHDYPDFEHFVLDGIRRVPRLRVPQVDYLVAPGKSADFIGRTERLDTDLELGLARAGLPVPERLERTNAGPASDYREHYTRAMRDRVAEVAARDVEELGYTFEG
jgi:Sulfotransferase family